MSTKKITALTELAAAAAATDMIPVVDVSDTTDAATGTTKKITATNIAKGVGIGAGNTTAEPVKIDTSNKRLGVGTNAPNELVDIGGVLCFGNQLTAVSNDTYPTIYATDSTGGSYPFNEAGNLVVEPRMSGATRDFVVAGTSGAMRMVVEGGGKVGIGTTAPNNLLHVASGTFPMVLERFSTDAAGDPGIKLQRSRGTSVGSYTVVQDDDELGTLLFEGADGDSWATAATIKCFVDGTPGEGDMPARLVFSTSADGSESSSERVRIDSTGNVLIGGTATPTSSVGNLCLFNGTIPAASVANGVVLYAEDATGSSELKVRDEAGNVGVLSPHNFDLIGDRSEDMAWSYSSKNVFVGKEIAVDMTKVIRALEKLTGEEYIKIRDIADSEKLDWTTEEKRKEAEQKKEIDLYKAKKAESDAHPTSSSTKAEVKAYLDKSGIEYEDAAKDKLFEQVPEKDEFTEAEPAAYSKQSKPSWMG